jgi:hypothetical protein
MDTFDVGRLLHSAVGILALINFWVAALAAKGSDRHRRAGKVYLLALIGVMALSLLMVAGQALRGEPAQAIFFMFLISMVGTASWLMWFSVRYHRAGSQLTGVTYRVLASWLVLAGAALFTLGVVRSAPLTMFLSLLGLGFGANMWRLALSDGRDERSWLSHHMNGAMLNFIATHDSFTALAIGSLLPVLREGTPRMLVAVGVTATAIALRIWFGLRYGPRNRSPAARVIASVTSRP